MNKLEHMLLLESSWHALKVHAGATATSRALAGQIYSCRAHDHVLEEGCPQHQGCLQSIGGDFIDFHARCRDQSGNEKYVFKQRGVEVL